MKIWKGALTQLSSQGYMTIQVPDIVIGEPIPPQEDLPDDWFIRKSLGGFLQPKLSMEGILYLSPKGFEANKEEILNGFEKSVKAGIGRGIPKDCENPKQLFQIHVDAFFTKLKTKTLAKASRLAEKAEKLAKLANSL